MSNIHGIPDSCKSGIQCVSTRLPLGASDDISIGHATPTVNANNNRKETL